MRYIAIFFFIFVSFSEAVTIASPPHRLVSSLHNSKVEKPAGLVDINTADEKTFQFFKGIGKQRARAIVAYRQTHGKFKGIEELLKVKGVSPKLVEKIKPHLKVV